MWRVRPAEQLHTLDVNKVQRVAPCARHGEETIRLAMPAICNFFSHPVVCQDAEPNHCLRIGNSRFEMQHFSGSGSAPDEESPAAKPDCGSPDLRRRALLS